MRDSNNTLSFSSCSLRGSRGLGTKAAATPSSESSSSSTALSQESTFSCDLSIMSTSFCCFSAFTLAEEQLAEDPASVLFPLSISISRSFSKYYIQMMELVFQKESKTVQSICTDIQHLCLFSLRTAHMSNYRFLNFLVLRQFLTYTSSIFTFKTKIKIRIVWYRICLLFFVFSEILKINGKLVFEWTIFRKNI